MGSAKNIAIHEIDRQSSELHELSKSIWNKPELAFKEFFSHKLLSDFFDSQGFSVERSFKLETAFRAVFTASTESRGPNIAVLCEYDALPGIGHACGHNLIAEVGVAAALGIKAAMIKCQNLQHGKVNV